MTIEVGQKVYLRGDIRRGLGGSCAYTDEQLVGGVYVKRHGSDRPWVGVVEAVRGDMVKVGGGWRGVEFYVPVDGQPQ